MSINTPFATCTVLRPLELTVTGPIFTDVLTPLLPIFTRTFFPRLILRLTLKPIIHSSHSSGVSASRRAFSS